jgi:hypothetical protein
MLESAGQIIPEALIGILRGEIYLSETDAEVIPSDGYSIIDITQAGAAETRGLANGREGQMLYMVNTAYAADTVVTPSSLANGSTITFNAVGDAWFGVFRKGEWWTLNLYGTAAIA